MTSPQRLAVALALPGLLWAVAQGAMLLGGALGWRPFQPTAPVSVAELVVLGDHAGVVGAIRSGADPNAPSAIRSGLPLGPTEAVTPLEAAVSTNQVPMVARLRTLGAVVHSGNYSALVCQARRMGAPKLAAYVEGLIPERPAVACD
jgi:hypothetical protein